LLHFVDLCCPLLMLLIRHCVVGTAVGTDSSNKAIDSEGVPDAY
jgi:hypothetical protein